MSLALVRLAPTLPPLMLQLAEQQIVTLIDCLGGCERISKTPTPLGYVLLIQRFAAIFLATLPFALVARVGMATPFITIIVAYPLLMIEALGSELDDPFGYDANDLALNQICITIQSDLTSTLAGLPDDRGPRLEDGQVVSSRGSVT
jgi:putative membrane protein